MGKLTKLTCFIVAPVGADTSVLRTALEQRNVKWVDATSAKPKWSILTTIESAIQNANFVCAVIPHGVKTSNVYFQLGMATGLRKPVLLFVEPGVDITVELASFEYVRATFDDEHAIDFNLDVFLDHLPPKPKVRTMKPPADAAMRAFGPKLIETEYPARVQHPISKEINVEWARRSISEIEQMPPMQAGQEFEKLVARLFREAGAIVRQQPSEFERGVDMALWLDEVKSSLQNPLMVEVKLGKLTKSSINEAEKTLRIHIAKARAEAGLLVYLDREGQVFTKVKAYWPLVFRFNIHELIELVGNGELVKNILAERNRVAHFGTT